MTDALRKEREQLLNRLVEIQVEINRIETENGIPIPPPAPEPAIRQVWRDLQNGRKFVVRDQTGVDCIKRNPAGFEFICDQPHADGDFSYR